MKQETETGNERRNSGAHESVGTGGAADEHVLIAREFFVRRFGYRRYTWDKGYLAEWERRFRKYNNPTDFCDWASIISMRLMKIEKKLREMNGISEDVGLEISTAISKIESVVF